MNAKDRLYNQGFWEVRRRSPDWRMRSRSDDGWDNITHPERGPQGPGGIAIIRWRRTQRRMTKLVEAIPKAGVNTSRYCGHVGTGLNRRRFCGRLQTELRGAWCLKPYWGKPNVRNFREGGWKRGPRQN